MTNPMLVPSPLPYDLPDFAQVKFEHFREALDAALDQARTAVQAIIDDPATPSFDNTILALENAGELLESVAVTFYAYVSSYNSPEILDLESEYTPKFSEYDNFVNLSAPLFERIKAVYDAREQLGLDAESQFLLERYYKEFSLRGAALSDEDRARLGALNTTISTLQTEFGKRLLADTNDSAVLFDSAEELAGLSDAEIEGCAKAAAERGQEGKFLVSLILPTDQPYMSRLSVRESRKKLLEASMARGHRDNANNTNDLILDMVKARAERAQLLGYPTHAAAVTADASAQTPEAIEEKIYPMAALATKNLAAEAAVLQEFADAQQDALGEPRFELAAYDWQYYASQVREDKYALDEAALMPYFEYDNVLQKGVFHAANLLYGLTFDERPELVGYTEDVRIFEVKDVDGAGLALFLHDVYARDNKRGGAWMNNLVEQSLANGTKPVICNNLNVPKPASGPTLLTLDDVRTMFHEFGHALHGMLSACQYRHLAGTNVSRDFVEFPSQVNEMWAQHPEIMANYAINVHTGEHLDPAIIAKLEESAKFNQGYETSAYLAAALLDQEWHKISPDAEITSVEEFEKQALIKVGLDLALCPPRYKSAYFNHTFGGGYDAGYYAYIWSEVLDADTVAWFAENGGLTRANGDHFRAELLSRGFSRETMASYLAFRGQEPDMVHLLNRRGLV